MRSPKLTLADFDYALPVELIAQAPSATRTGSRLLCVDGTRFADRRFADIVELVDPGDVVVMNDTRVLRARISGRKRSGGLVEMLVERVLGPDEAWVQLKASHPPATGSILLLPAGASASVVARDRGFFRLRFHDIDTIETWLEIHGTMPLPPYIARPSIAADDERYQTVYARVPGAVAAPTAGLHFDAGLLARVQGRGAHLAWVTLHVGAGTFLPVREEDPARHRMHSERFVVPQETVQAIATARRRGGRVLAVGTTSLRALEAASSGGTLVACAAETDLFITPGYRFVTVDRLLTNFHLPRSTLLMLVCAFAGLASIRRAYEHAIRERYRFYSYGDAMLVEPARQRVE